MNAYSKPVCLLSICTAQSVVLFAEDVEYRRISSLKHMCVYVFKCASGSVCVDVMLITNKSSQRKQ